jgi:PAS domain S-box-containing protein
MPAQEDFNSLYERYKMVIDNMVEALVITDKDRNIIDWNKGAEAIFGYSKEEVLGKPINILIPPEFLDVHEYVTKKLSQGGKSQIIEAEGICKNTERVPVALSVSASLTDKGLFYTSLIRDVTHRKNNEKQIKMLNETLRVRVDALEAFQYSVSHDLNAPLRAMEGLIEILVEDYDHCLDGVGKDYVERIKRAIQRMRNLIQDMIRLSRVTQPEVELKFDFINLSIIAKSIIENLKINYPKPDKYVVEIQEDIYAQCDKEFIEIALKNLLDNAWKFSNKKEQPKIEFGKSSCEGETIYFIRDNGIGFDMSKIDRLFKPFSRLHDKSEFEGNGIGLTVVKRVISLHEGRIWAESIPNKGTTFYFTIGTKNNV